MPEQRAEGRVGRRERLRRRLAGPPRRVVRPAAYVVTLLASVVAVGTVLLLLPVSRAGPGGAPPVTAFFTSVSAVSVTGLSTVDTATYWTGFGQLVIALLVQAGGLGITTGAALLGLAVSRRLGLRTRLYASTETGGSLGEMRRVVIGVTALSFAVEAVTTVALTLRWWLGYDYSFGKALWYGLFHSVAAYNNAGFSLFSDSLAGFESDGVILLTICVAIILGGVGVPVLLDLVSPRRGWKQFSLHSRITVATTVTLLVFGFVAVAVAEWSNPQTLGPLSAPAKLLNSFFGSVSPRTAGFNTFSYSDTNPETRLVTDMLMFVGGGSVSTAGGIRVTTLAVLGLVMWSQARGDREVDVADRRVPLMTVQQALTITVVFATLTIFGTLGLLTVSDTTTDSALFETISALGTVGLTADVTPTLGGPAQILVAVMMFVGRVGPTTLATALALRQRDKRYQRPEGRVLVG